MSLSNNEASNADIENAINQSTQHAERVATAAFGQLFRILKNWSRDSEPLSFTYDFFCQGLRKSRPLIGTHLRIDSSSFPEVACIGSLKMSEGHDWGIHPESTFQLLTRLPNAKQATMTFEDELESAEIIQSVEEGHATVSFQKLKLEALYLESVSMWKRRRDPGLHIHPSLQLSQSVSAMASRLEELYISHVVDVPYFLSQAWGAGQTTPHGSPAWPNMRILCLRGHSMWASSESPAYAAELYDSVTKALPQMPKITRFDITIESPYYSFGRWDWLNTIVYMEIPPRGYPPAMQDGMLLAGNVGLDAETVDTWKQIARSQWYCELVPFQ
ncbi:hypothetical protein UCDDA912_g08670 [Diaporthe ampelina]|uniref:DUF6546 domain-containing protein n=1 Tax=Diaporthe ampelina TaxID=1214573 RepID=A0A0G2F9N1_9PEZI|nr:hypothetical protein UCDDA912_g08670 [Diaporthe ampelina]